VRIYDVAGRAVRTITESEYRGPGTHRIRFERRGLPSGLYLVRLEAGSSFVTRKVVLLR